MLLTSPSYGYHCQRQGGEVHSPGCVLGALLSGLMCDLLCIFPKDHPCKERTSFLLTRGGVPLVLPFMYH